MVENTTTSSNLDLDAPIAPARLHHIAFRTTRLQEMKDFYRIFLGVHPTFEVEGIASFLTFDISHHRIVIFHNPSSAEPAPISAGMHHVAFEHDSVDNLMRAYQRLKRKGILPGLALDHGPTVSFYYGDPDRNVIELQIDNFGPDAQKSMEAMLALRNNPNPLGVPINVETYLSAWQEGATLAELHQRAQAGEFVEGAAQLPPLSHL